MAPGRGGARGPLWAVVLALLSTSALFVDVVGATSRTLTATRVQYISSLKPTTNLNSVDSLQISDNAGTATRAILFAFDISSIVLCWRGLLYVC